MPAPEPAPVVEPEIEPEVEPEPEPAPPAPLPLVVQAPPQAPEPVPEPAPQAAPPSEEMASVTLAELYFNQGFADKAVAVLKQLLAREPLNQRAQARLEELEAREARLKVEQEQVASVVGPGVDPKAIRRQAIARTIAELEKLLAAVRKG
jgi:hypothetical protein